MSQRDAHAHQTNTPVMAAYIRNRETDLNRSNGAVVSFHMRTVQAPKRIRFAISTMTAMTTNAENIYMLLFIITR